MGDITITADKVYFSNGNKCGTIEYDKLWDTYRFVPEPDCKFSADWLFDIAKTMYKKYRK